MQEYKNKYIWINRKNRELKGILFNRDTFLFYNITISLTKIY